MRAVLDEQRRRPRRRTSVPQGIWISMGAGRQVRTVAAKLIDGSDAGVGVETFAPLPVGSIVVVKGKLTEPGYALALQGQARVMYTRELENGMFRIGLSFEDVSYRRSA